MTASDASLPPADRRRRARLQFALVALAFLGTPLLATLLYAYGDKGHRGVTVNRGALIDPARPIAGAEALGLADAWTLVVHAPEGCTVDCERTLVTLRQVRLTFAKDIVRIRRVLITGAADDGPRLRATHPDLRVLSAVDAEAFAVALRGALQEQGGEAPPDHAGRSFLVDPLGNLMMTYAPDPAPADVQADLKRLLKNSESWMRR